MAQEACLFYTTAEAVMTDGRLPSEIEIDPGEQNAVGRCGACQAIVEVVFEGGLGRKISNPPLDTCLAIKAYAASRDKHEE